MTIRNVSMVLGTLGLGLGLLIGCGTDGTPPASFDTEGWIDTAPPGPPGPRPGHAEEGEDDDEDEDEEDEDEDDENGTYWGLFGPYAGGQFSEVEGEFFAAENGVEVCILLFPATIRGAADGCDACTATWEIELGAPEPEIDIDGACQRLGPSQIEGLVLRVGLAGSDVLMRDEGEGWMESGEFEIDEGELWMEWTD